MAALDSSLERSYLHWLNFVLKAAGERCQMGSLEEICSGPTLLCVSRALIGDDVKGEKLSDEEQLSVALKRLKDDHCKIPFNPEDLKQTTKESLFQICRALVTRYQCGADAVTGSHLIKTRLITWINEQIRTKNIELSLNDFDWDSIGDGQVLAVLLSSLPQFNVQYDELDLNDTDSLYKVIATKPVEAGLPSLVEYDDFVNQTVHPDALLTFTACVRYGISVGPDASKQRSSLHFARLNRPGRKGGRSSLGQAEDSPHPSSESATDQDDQLAYEPEQQEAAEDAQEQAETDWRKKYEEEAEALRAVRAAISDISEGLTTLLEKHPSDSANLDQLKQRLEQTRKAVGEMDAEHSNAQNTQQSVAEELLSLKERIATLQSQQELREASEKEEAALSASLEEYEGKLVAVREKYEDLQKEISTQLTELEALRTEEATLSTSLQSNSSREEGVKEKAEALKRELDAAQKDTEEREAEKSSLSAQLETAQERLSVLRAQAEEAEKSAAEEASLRSQVHSKEEELNSLQEKRKQAEDAIEVTKRSLNQIKAEEEELAEKLKENPEEYRAKKEELEASLADLCTKVELEAAIHSNLLSDRDMLAEELKTLEKRKKEQEDSSQDLSEDISRAKARYLLAKEELEKQKASLQNSMSENDELERYNQQLSKQIENIWNVCGPSLSEVEALESRLQELNTKIRLEKDSQQELDSERDRREKQLQKIMEQLSLQMDDLSNSSRIQEKQDGELTQKKDRLQLEVAEKESQIESLEKETSKLTEELSALSLRLTEETTAKQGRISELEGEKAKAEVVRKALQAEVNALEKSIAELASKEKIAQEQAATKSKELQQRRASLSTVNSRQIEELEQAVQAEQNKVRALESRKSDLSRALDAQTQRNKAMQGDQLITALAQEQRELDTLKKNHEDKVSRLQAEIAELRAKVDKEELSLKLVQSNLAQEQAATNALEKGTAKTQSEIENVRKEKEGLKNTIASLNGEKKELSEQLNQLHTEKVAARSKAKKLRGEESIPAKKKKPTTKPAPTPVAPVPSKPTATKDTSSPVGAVTTYSSPAATPISRKPTLNKEEEWSVVGGKPSPPPSKSEKKKAAKKKTSKTDEKKKSTVAETDETSKSIFSVLDHQSATSSSSSRGPSEEWKEVTNPLRSSKSHQRKRGGPQLNNSAQLAVQESPSSVSVLQMVSVSAVLLAVIYLLLQ